MKLLNLCLIILLNSIICECQISNAAIGLPGYTSYKWASDLNGPRGIQTASTGEIIVVEAGANQISCLWDDDKDGYSGPSERAVIASASGLNHGVMINGNYLYASSSTTVYRWELNSAGIRRPLSNPSTVVVNIPGGGHSTRTLEFDPNGDMYVSCGSGSNVDSDPSRSLIRKFKMSSIPSGGYQFTNGSIFAIGLRNEVGLRFDKDGNLWGVENGVDQVNRAPFGDVHNDNPGEELNFFGSYTSQGGSFYGYPYCWSAYIIEGQAPLTQFAQNPDSQYNDNWCQNTTNVVLPKYLFPAHTAPLDIRFLNDNSVSLPGIKQGDAIVTLHGSWNRSPPQGYRVMLVQYNQGQVDKAIPLWYASGTESDKVSQAPSGWAYRPVAVAFANCQGSGSCILVTSGTGDIISIASGEAPNGTDSNGNVGYPSGSNQINISIMLIVLVAVAALF